MNPQPGMDASAVQAKSDGPTPPTDTERPLVGVKVIEFAQFIAAPSTSVLLADYGAEVTKVEPPRGDPIRGIRSAAARNLELSPHFVAYNRDKRLLQLDLREEAGREAAWDLIREADVVIESSRPGVMDRLGLGADSVLKRFPHVIYASVSGFGWDEVMVSRPGVDFIVQAESGIMSTTGYPDTGPTKVGVTIVDTATGHALCHGILAALLRRWRTGQGGIVRVSLYDVALHLQAGPILEFLMTGRQEPRVGNSAPFTAPSDAMKCMSGEIVVAAYQQPHWERFACLIGAEELLSDPRFATETDRVENRSAMLGLLERFLASRSAEDWITVLSGAGIVAGQVKDHAAVVAHEALRDRSIIERTGSYFAVRNPVQLFGSVRIQHVPPIAERPGVKAES